MFSPVGHKKVLLELERVKSPTAREELLSSIRRSDSSSVLKRSDSTGSSPGDRSPSPTDMLKRMRSRESFEVVHHSKAIKSQTLEEILQDDGELGDAARKLMEVAVRYRPERDSAVITAFNTCSLTPEEFRKLLYNAFKLSFTDGEFKRIVKVYAKDGIVDGSEFLVSFVKLGSIASYLVEPR